MNQGRIWCVVNPTVGLPLFIGGVAVTSLIVHASVMTHVTWMGNYWQGKAARTAMNSTAVPALSSSATPGFTVSIDPVASNDKSGASFVVTVAPDVKAHPVAVAAK